VPIRESDIQKNVPIQTVPITKVVKKPGGAKTSILDSTAKQYVSRAVHKKYNNEGKVRVSGFVFNTQLVGSAKGWTAKVKVGNKSYQLNGLVHTAGQRFGLKRVHINN